MISQAERDLFLLAVLLIVVAYFVGFSTDASTLFKGISNLVVVGSGRNPNTFEFAQYPTSPKVP